jgi:hypothetical protein
MMFNFWVIFDPQEIFVGHHLCTLPSPKITSQINPAKFETFETETSFRLENNWELPKLLAYDATISSAHPKNSKLKEDLNLQSLGFEDQC